MNRYTAGGDQFHDEVIHEALVLAAAAGNFVFKHFFQKPSLNS
jgi:hypothetical protein